MLHLLAAVRLRLRRRPAPSVARTAQPAGVGRHPDHAVGQSADHHRQRERAGRGRDGHHVAVGRRPISAAVAGRHRRPTGLAVPARCSSPSCSRPASSSSGQVASDRLPGRAGARHRARHGAAAGRAGAASRRRGAAARRGPRRRPAGPGGRPSRRPARRAPAGRSGRRCSVERRVERPAPALPVHEAAGLLGDRGHRQHHVGRVGDRAGPHLQADHEAGSPRARARAGRVGAGRPGPRRRRPARRARRCAAAARIARRRGRAGRQRGRAPGRGDLGRGPAASSTGRPTGQQAGQRAGLDRAALAGPARHPGELRAGGLGQRDRGGQRAGHARPAARRPGSPRRAGAAPGRGDVGVVEPPRPAPSAAGSAPGAAAAGCRAAWPGRGEASGAIARTPRGRACGPPCAAAGRRSATRPRARSRPAARRGRPRDRRRTRASRCRGRPARRRGSQLLLAPSAGAPGSRRRWCPARPGRTWRRRRRPQRSSRPPGSTPTPRAVARRAQPGRGRGSSASGQRGRDQLAVLVAHQRRRSAGRAASA